MNNDQFNSMLRTIIKMGGAALAAHGMTNAANFINAEDTIGLILSIVGFVMSHNFHSQKNATPESGAAVSTATKVGLLFLCASLFVSGCGTPQQATYRTAGTVVVSVDTAMNLWGAYVKSNHPPIAQEMAVRAAFDKYQAAASLACDVGKAYAAASQTKSDSNTLSQLEAALAQALGSSDQDLADLEALITSFGVKLQ